MKHRTEIDGLRAIAVIPVILFHAGFEIFSGGFVGVDVFFVISGYLITTLIITDLNENQFSLIKFYERRARRLLPALYFVVLCCIPFAWYLLLPGDMEEFTQSVIATVTLSSNVLFWQKSGYFNTLAELKPLLHTWSLAVEGQFYILFPLFLIAARRFERRTTLRVLLLAFLLSLAAAQWGAYREPSATFYLLPTRAWELLLGTLAAFYLQSKKNRDTANWVKDFLSILGLTAILYSTFAFDKATPYPSIYTLVPTVGTLFIILFAGPGTIVHSFLSTRGLVGVGLISYSLYLLHQPIFVFWRHYNFSEPSHYEMTVLSLMCFPLAYLLYRFIERPFRKLNSTGRSRSLFNEKITSLGLLLLIGFFWAAFCNRLELKPAVTPTNYDLIQGFAFERQAAIQAGICHFNERGRYADIDAFLKNWSCNPLNNAKQPRAAVYGDSHAADKAVALRESGIIITQLGGAGCPLLKTSTPSYCNELLDRFVEEVSEHPYELIFLSNRFENEELSGEYMRRLIDFWSKVHSKVLIFSPMPEYNNFERVFSASSEMATQMAADTTGSVVFFKLFEEITLPSNIILINTEAMFCNITKRCSPIEAGIPLLTDTSHLSLHGARQFGLQLLHNIAELESEALVEKSP